MARRVAPTTAEVPMTMGWSKGMAAQLNLPNNISMSHQWSGDLLRAAGDDRIEQAHGDLRVGRSALRPTRLCHLRESRRIEYAAFRLHLADPGLDILRRHRIHIEAHVGEALAAELCRQALIRPALVGLEVHVGRHPRHGVNLAAELRDEEAVHDARGSQAESHGPLSGQDQVIEAGNVLPGIDEQPLPVERDHLDFERFGTGLQRSWWVEV